MTNAASSQESARDSERFQRTYCSMCGAEFGPGSSGYSHCADHREKWLAAEEDSASLQDRIDALERVLERIANASVKDESYAVDVVEALAKEARDVLGAAHE